MKQEQINELLAQKALQYDIVVRLKGGIHLSLEEVEKKPYI